MKKISFFTNYNIPDKAETVYKAARQALDCGAEVYFPIFLSSNRTLKDELGESNIFFLPNRELYSSCDIVCVAGGDGSLLEACKRCAETDTPVLGINRGHVGYMAELENNETELISKVIAGEFRTEERFIMRVEVHSDGKLLRSDIAMNDAVISGGATGKMTELTLTDSGNTVGNFRSDGLIISTPTGSTAYSLSAGGPVIDPRMNCFCVTPICAHSPWTRPTVFPGESVLTITNYGTRCTETALVLDGKFAGKLEKEHILELKDSGLRAKLIRVKPQRYYHSLCRKID